MDESAKTLEKIMQPQPLRPRRSCLYLPGSNQRALQKARTLSADVVILDLEDAVAPEEKTEARSMVCEAVSEKQFGHREVVIRINSLDTDWGAEDLRAAISANPNAILVPKINSTDDMDKIIIAMREENGLPDIVLWTMIETPLSILNIQSIAAASAKIPLATFVMGTNDLAKELHVSPAPGRSGFLYALSKTVMAARAYDIAVIDGVFNDIEDHDGFYHECCQGKELGFDGKTLIHPLQIKECNRVFSPTKEEIRTAKRIVDVFEDPSNQGKGVLSIDGKMTELLHLEEARRILTIFETIEKNKRY